MLLINKILSHSFPKCVKNSNNVLNNLQFLIINAFIMHNHAAFWNQNKKYYSSYLNYHKKNQNKKNKHKMNAIYEFLI